MACKEKTFTVRCNECGREMTLANKFVMNKKSKIKIYMDWEGDLPEWLVFKCSCGNRVDET